MIGWLLLTAFAAQPVLVSDVADVEPPVQTLKIDILVRPAAQRCDATAADEIVVCAEKTDNESQRLRPIANAGSYDNDESKAEFNISENVRMAAEVDSNQLGGGIVSKSIMARVKIKF